MSNFQHQPLQIIAASLPKDEVLTAVAKLLVFGFSGKSVNAHARRLISMGAGGVILFSRNVEEPEQVAKLCSDLKREAGGRKLITMVDQEGGPFTRLSLPFTPIPAARVVGKTGDVKAAAAMAHILGKELRAVNIDMDLAPVLDVDMNALNPVIGPRSFGNSSMLVSELGYSFIRGLQWEGVAACAKHFPGHGDTTKDSHLELPFLSHSLERLREIELPPFGKAAEADVASIMIAHIVVPSLRGHLEKDGMPATMSKGVIDYLRNELSFQGLVISDCLEMGAILKNYPIEEAAVQAILAGVDMLLVCHTQKRQVRVIQALAKAVFEGIIPYKRIKDAGMHVDALVRTYYRAPPAQDDDFEVNFQLNQLQFVGCKDHHDMVSNVLYQAAAVSST